MPQFDLPPIILASELACDRKSPGAGFLEQVANACRVKHFAYRTEQVYVAWVKRFILFHDKRPPKDMGEQEIIA